MDRLSPKKATTDIGASEVTGKAQGAGPIARLLAGFSRLGNEYAAYKMDSCDWRKLAL